MKLVEVYQVPRPDMFTDEVRAVYRCEGCGASRLVQHAPTMWRVPGPSQPFVPAPSVEHLCPVGSYPK